MSTRVQQGHRLARDEHGVAMLEFVLMLPFIWLVLALVIDFGLAFAERQRAMVAVREVAMRHSVASAANGPAAIVPIVDEVTTELLTPRRMSARVVHNAGDGTCPRDGEAADGGPVRDAFGPLLGFLKDVSSSHTYRITATGQPLVSQWLGQPVQDLCYAIDGSPWTYDETGDPADWLANRIGGLGRTILDAIF